MFLIFLDKKGYNFEHLEKDFLKWAGQLEKWEGEVSAPVKRSPDVFKL